MENKNDGLADDFFDGDIPSEQPAVEQEQAPRAPEPQENLELVQLRLEKIELQNKWKEAEEKRLSTDEKANSLEARLKELEAKQDKTSDDEELKAAQEDLIGVLGESGLSALQTILRKVEGKTTTIPDTLIAQAVSKKLSEQEALNKDSIFRTELQKTIPDIGSVFGDPKFVQWAKETSDGVDSVYDNLARINSRREIKDIAHIKRYRDEFSKGNVGVKPPASAPLGSGHVVRPNFPEDTDDFFR